MSSFDTLDNLERRMSERKAAKLDERIEQLERDLAAANARVGELDQDVDDLNQQADYQCQVRLRIEQERDAARAELEVADARIETLAQGCIRRDKAIDVARAEATALRGVVELLHSWLIHHKWCKVYTFAPDYSLDDARCTCNLTATLAAAAAVPEPAPNHIVDANKMVEPAPDAREADLAHDLAVVEAFITRVNQRAEFDIERGNPITGAHHRAQEFELTAFRKAASAATPPAEPADPSAERADGGG